MLYVLGTPIGNLSDISARAKDALAGANLIIAENPGHSKILLDYFNLGKKEFIQFAEHNEQDILERVIDRLKKDDAVFVTDAGTPGISDPGFRLVRACIENQIPLTAIPGANAAITALSVSGLPTDKFVFLGFLPKTEIKLTKMLEQAKALEATIIFYESPFRILKTTEYIEKTWPDAQYVVARELTKMHEEVLRGTVREVLAGLKSKPSIKGEITALISFKEL